MKTFTLDYESNYEGIITGYNTEGITSKGIISIRGISLNKERTERWAKEDNEKVPFYDATWECMIYRVRVVEVHIFTK